MSSTPILDKVNNPARFKGADPAQLEQLAAEIREFIIQVVAVNGGHLAPEPGRGGADPGPV
jgi:1-deoxy-D-xylulose-5-phosphate synthase